MSSHGLPTPGAHCLPSHPTSRPPADALGLSLRAVLGSVPQLPPAGTVGPVTSLCVWCIGQPLSGLPAFCPRPLSSFSTCRPEGAFENVSQVHVPPRGGGPRSPAESKPSPHSSSLPARPCRACQPFYWCCCSLCLECSSLQPTP